jgi:hypothetical protein
MKLDGKLKWVIWQFDCLILQDEERFEEYLTDMEERLIIHKFILYLEDYAAFRFEELSGKYTFKVLRDVRILNSELSELIPVAVGNKII